MQQNCNIPPPSAAGEIIVCTNSFFTPRWNDGGCSPLTGISAEQFCSDKASACIACVGWIPSNSDHLLRLVRAIRALRASGWIALHASGWIPSNSDHLSLSRIDPAHLLWQGPGDLILLIERFFLAGGLAAIGSCVYVCGC